MVMSISAFNKLPADVQNVMMDVSNGMIDHMVKRELEFIPDACKVYEECGMTLVEFPENQQKQFEDVAVMPVVDEWIEDMEDQGLPAREVFWAFRDAAEKYANMPH